MVCKYFVPVCNFFFSTGAWTQGLHLEPLHQPFFVIVFFQLGNYLPGLALNHDLPDISSWVARITGVNHLHPAPVSNLCFHSPNRLFCREKKF
jgi:hypothetical protein